MTDKQAGISTILILLVLLLAVVVFSAPDYVWKGLAIAHGALHYDAQTGAFKWNDDP